MSEVIEISKFRKTKTPDGIEVDSIAYAVGVLSELIGREWNGVLCVKTYDDNAVQVFPMGFNEEETKHFLAAILQMQPTHTDE